MALENIEPRNKTRTTELILLGFRNHHVLQTLLFLLFLLIYIVTMTGNILIVLLVATDRHLHTPMYYFLGNLSFLETCCSTNILPRMLSSFLTRENVISLSECFVQNYFFGTFGAVECYLLSVMSYDRYLAVCKPLQYVNMMSGRLCFQLIAGSWLNGFFANSLLIIFTSKLVFCVSNEIDHFFCDTFPVIEGSCSDTHILRLVVYVTGSMFTFPPFILTLISYIFIIAAIMRIPSTTGKQKAFSTCSSHLFVVTLFYCTLMLVYVVPSTKTLRGLQKIFSVFYTILTPMINPIIYSLRNKEVKNALKKLTSCLFVQPQKKRVSCSFPICAFPVFLSSDGNIS